MKKIRREEVELRDRTTVLQGGKPNVCRVVGSPAEPDVRHEQNFAAIRNVVGDRLKKIREMSKAGAVPATAVPKTGELLFSCRVSPSHCCAYRSEDGGEESS